ncbi:MAG: hypothetical protein HY824_12000 [Acidobacteria bacterium]|nr:hypothetical protein [Acidobacteriota bacterium]
MIRTTIVLALSWLTVPALAGAAPDAMLFRLYLTDGTAVVSYGEFSRVGDRVVFSMVLGGAAEPRIHAATLPASVIDWTRTDRDAASTRYQWYAHTRGEDDFGRVSDEVAAVLNAVVRGQNRAQALDAAQRARATLTEWAHDHFGYRQQDVREILAVLDEAISDLRAATGVAAFEVSLVARASDVALEPIAGMPSVLEQINQTFHVAALTDAPAERVALLQAALRLIAEERSVLPPVEAANLRRFAESRIREEQVIDRRYADLTRRLMTQAAQGASRALSGDVQRVLDRLPREDARLGRRRPDVVQALRVSVQAQLDAARRLRLLRDQWAIRRSLYSQYQRSVGVQLLQLVKSQPALEAIRRLDGPPPEMLRTLQARLRGGAERLERVQAPPDLRTMHELLLGAWRFAEQSVNGRYDAARTANVGAAWEASSSAAGALLLLSRAQQELRTLLEPPKLQ